MEAYITYLESVPFSPGLPSRSLAPLLDGSNRVLTLRELLSNRLEYLVWAVPGEEGDEIREEMKKLREMANGWLSMLYETFSSR